MTKEMKTLLPFARCDFVTAAGIRCRLPKDHTIAHDTTYIFDALPNRPETNAEPLPEDLERLLRDPNVVTEQDHAFHFWLRDYLLRDPAASVTREAYLSLWALYEKELADA